MDSKDDGLFVVFCLLLGVVIYFSGKLGGYLDKKLERKPSVVTVEDIKNEQIEWKPWCKNR